MGQKFIISFLTILLSSISGFSQSAEEYFEMAKKVYPNYEKAVYFLTKAIFKEPNNAAWHLARAKVNTFSDKPKDSEIERDLKKALELAPADPYVNCWYLSSGLVKNDGDKNSILVDLFETAKKDPEVLNYYINYQTGYKKSFVFENRDEIEELLKKSPKTFRNIITYWRFLMLEGKRKQAATLIELLKSLPYSELTKDIQPKHEMLKDSVPLIGSNFSQYNLDDKSFYDKKNFALKVRLLDEEFVMYEMNKSRYIKQYRVNKPAPLVSTFHIEALLTLGRLSDALKYAKANYKGYSKTFMARHQANALKAMGLYGEAAKILETLVKDDSYLNKETYSLIESLVKDQQFEKALNIAQKLKRKSIPEENLKKLLLCKYYVTTQQFGAWERNYKNIKKFHGTSSYHEMMQQVNVVRTTCGNPHLNIYQKNKDNSPHNQLEMIFTQANSALFKKKNDEAESLLKLAKSLSRDDFRNNYIEASHLFKIGKTEDALRKIDELLSLSSTYEKGIILKGMIQLEKNDHKGAYATFGALANKRTSAYYKVLTLFCLGKFNTALTACEKLVKTNCDIRIFPIYHMLKSRTDKDAADQLLKENMNKFKTATTITYANYKLGKDDLKSYNSQLNYGPILSPNFNFTIGFEAMQKGEKEKALKHFKKCLIPYSIDLPEYHMAKTCIKMLEK